MAKNATILSVDEENQFVEVLYEDDGGASYQTAIPLDQEFSDEESLLDHIANFWPHEIFAQKAKPPANRHVEAKKNVGVKKNITARVRIP